jgi:hypothetical protein
VAVFYCGLHYSSQHCSLLEAVLDFLTIARQPFVALASTQLVVIKYSPKQAGRQGRDELDVI